MRAGRVAHRSDFLHQRIVDGETGASVRSWTGDARPYGPLALSPRGDLLASRYRLLRPLGHGTSADVYLAQSFVPGAPGTVALKIR